MNSAGMKNYSGAILATKKLFTAFPSSLTSLQLKTFPPVPVAHLRRALLDQTVLPNLEKLSLSCTGDLGQGFANEGTEPERENLTRQVKAVRPELEIEWVDYILKHYGLM
ncbi:hypothetical protein JCM10213_002597 [Rhodosporidiobolus nylandii]